MYSIAEVWHSEPMVPMHDNSLKRGLSHTTNSTDDCNSIDDSVSDDVLAALQPRKKRIRKRLFIPRVISTDVRRYIGFMLTNVLNSHDRGTLFAFLSRYAAPNIEMTKNSGMNQETRRQVRLTGINNLANYWSIMIDLDPDRIITTLDSQVHTYMHTDKSTVRCPFAVKLTKMYAHNAYPSAVAKLVECRNTYCTASSPSTSPTELGSLPCRSSSSSNPVWMRLLAGWSTQCSSPNESDGNGNNDDHLPCVRFSDDVLLKLNPRPLYIEMSGMLTFGMNEDRRIETLDLWSSIVRMEEVFL